MTIDSTVTKDRGNGSAPDSELDVELMVRQVHAIQAWTATTAVAEPVSTATVTREMRLDLSRRVEARRREHQALTRRAAEHLQASGSLLSGERQPRALLAHRNDWLRGKLRGQLEDRGVVIVGEFDDGAEVAGTLVAEQPDLVLVEDRLPTVSGFDVMRRAQRFAPMTVVGAHVLDGSGIEPAKAAGALAVFTRRIPPAAIATDLVACLARRRPVTRQ